MELVERDEELAVLDRLLDDALAGRGRVAVVSGAVATGKSELLEAFAGRATQAGALALTAVSSAEETGLPWGVLCQILRAAPLTSEERTRVKELISQASPTDPPDPPDPDLAQEICLVLLELAERHPLVLLVDDAHQADLASLTCLGYLARRLRDARVVIVPAEPDHLPDGPSAFRLELLRRPHSQSIPLVPLTLEGVRRRAHDSMGAETAELIAEDCYSASGGNPLLVRALLTDHQAAIRAVPGDPPSELVVGDRYRRALLACLRRGAPGMSEVAAALAVLGAPDSASRLLGRDDAEVGQVLHGMDAAGLLHAGRLRHPAGRAAVLLDLGSQRRTDLHRRAADLAYEDGASATVVAGHLLAARHTEAPWAVAVLEDAAVRALADGRMAPAIAYLKLACGACLDEPRLARIRTTLVRAEWRIDPSVPTSRLDELTDAHFQGHLRGSDALVLVKALLWHGRFDDARRVLTHLSRSDTLSDPETAAELRATHPWMRCSYAPLLDLVPALDDQGSGDPGTPSLADGRRLKAATALDTVLSQGPSEQAVAEAERILRGARLDEMGMDTVECALSALVYSERPDLAAPWCDDLLAEAVTRESPGRHARLSTIRAEISFRQGDLAAAERHARRALDIIPPDGWGVTLGASSANLVLPLLAMGRHDKALEEIARPVPEAMLQSRYGLRYLQARGRCGLATGSLDAALADFRLCGELMGRWDLDVPGLISWRLDAAEVLLRMGDKDGARDLIDEQLDRCGPGARRTRGSALRLLAAASDPRRRPAPLRQAADILQAVGDDYELARALTDLAGAYAAVGEPRRAAMIGRRAWALAQDCHAQPLVQALVIGTGQRGVTSPARDAEALAASVLSDAELRVVQLAVNGHTNREISKRLCVTVSTVEQHLTRAYRKLNVTSRAELPSALHGARDGFVLFGKPRPVKEIGVLPDRWSAVAAAVASN